MHISPQFGSVSSGHGLVTCWTLVFIGAMHPAALGESDQSQTSFAGAKKQQHPHTSHAYTACAAGIRCVGGVVVAYKFMALDPPPEYDGSIVLQMMDTLIVR